MMAPRPVPPAGPFREKSPAMKHSIDHGAMAVAGYARPWHTTAGRPVTLHLSAAEAACDVRVVRLDTPAAEPQHWPVSLLEPPAHRSFEQGSYLRVCGPSLARAAPVTGIGFELLLTHNDGERVIAESDGFRLSLADGRLALRLAGSPVALPQAALPVRTWMTVRLAQAGEGVELCVEGHDPLAPFRLHCAAGRHWQPPATGLTLGTSLAADTPALNARFAAPVLETGSGRLSWQFPTLVPDGPMPAREVPGVTMEAVNQPTFCVTSRRFDGSGYDPRLLPHHYDAIHCHDDDMGPLDWPASFSTSIPPDAPAGIYAFEVRQGAVCEPVVFFVESTAATAPLLFLVPTATYLAYADERLPEDHFPWVCEDRGQRFAADNNLRSLYDFHSDHSGVSITSWRRPKATLRPDYRYPLCGAPHNLPVDLHFLRFCHRHGIAFDLITDHGLHARGAAALEGHAAVMTGSHPEYMSADMEAALRGFAAGGGSLAYLGGNGFAARVAFRGDLMELRRSPLEVGRTWDGPVSEQVLALTNEPGGFLRNAGRGEFSLIGGAMSLMGFERAHPFTRTPRSHEADVGWLFEGVGSESFGHDGIVLGGAAGYEVDATDPHLGTAPDTVVVARAAGFPAAFADDAARWYAGGEDERARRRCAEMTVRRLKAGGWIFSASSVAFLGALPDDGMNDVGRITLNLLRRIAALPASPA